MSKDNTGIYSHELDDVLNYMVDILVNEFPTDIFTPEYLMVSIFDINNCHANMILDNCLMSNNMEELKEIYMSVLKDHSKPLIGETDRTKVQFDFELNKILETAKEEKNKTNAKVVGTEHVLLAILNPKNNIKIREVFNTVGIEYNFILDKCMEEPSKSPALKPIKAKGLINNNGGALKPAIFPLKSEVNATSIIAKDEFISKYTTNLNTLAKEGKLDELVGRKAEIQEIIKVLARRKKNNVILVGNGGVGKTAIINGLATMIVNGNVPPILEGKEIVMIDIMALVSGTHFRGMLEERVKGLFDELKSSNKYILFINKQRFPLHFSWYMPTGMTNTLYFLIFRKNTFFIEPAYFPFIIPIYRINCRAPCIISPKNFTTIFIRRAPVSVLHTRIMFFVKIIEILSHPHLRLDSNSFVFASIARINHCSLV